MILFSPLESYFDKNGRPTAMGQQLLAALNRVLAATDGAVDGLGDDLTTGLAGKADMAHTHPLADLTQSGATTGQRPHWAGAWVPYGGPEVGAWTPDTGTAKRTAQATYTAPFASAGYVQAEMQAVMDALQNTSRTVKALKDDLLAHGDITT